ncbi:serine/threonine-protein kinase BSK1-2-like [Dioscorea cayenensis subsp. rotundata]|uniref:Serine/threonine-protein kinase BSK1-2-like n=1 Tax=Dioscorea cayennensis subsp. rotundata TaxID=55577 RepID=A0AB40C3C0_DIOCR|nr:serine/threonine-protein kinase BSK1-2-like [Dioscorea cayenensis subsp. rotundata]
MGCCPSAPNQLEDPNSGDDGQHNAPSTNVNPTHHQQSQPPAGKTAPIPHYTLAELMEATNGFSFGNIIPEGGSGREGGAKVPNTIYRSHLRGLQQIAVKRFSRDAWPDAEHFREEAIAVGRLRHRRLVNLIGYCCDGNERLLVAEFMPNDTLAKHLFKNHNMKWARRLRVASYVAEALEYCSNEGRAVYHDLNSYRILFDKDGIPCLSCFGLVKNSRDSKCYSTNLAYNPPEFLNNGRITPESVIFSFGTVLLDLLTGKQVPPGQALDMMRDNDIHTFLDPHLKGKYPIEEATALVQLASQCLRYEPKARPTIAGVFATLVEVQSKALAMWRSEKQDKNPPMLRSSPKPNETPQMQGTQKQDKARLIRQPTSFPMAEAVVRMDLTAIHQILVSAQYNDDEANGEASFREWTQQVRDMLEIRKRGDSAFNDRVIKTAIECYSQFVDLEETTSPTVYVRRSLCYLMSDQPDNALQDAMLAQCIQPDWPMVFYMQAVALRQLNMNSDSADMLKEATTLEEQRLTNTRQGT